MLQDAVEQDHDQVALSAAGAAEHPDVVGERSHRKTHRHGHQWPLPGKKMADNQPGVSELSPQELVHGLPRFIPVGVYPKHVGQVLGKPPRAVERPSASFVDEFRVTEYHPAQLNELFFGQVLGEERIRHRQLVSGHVAHLERTVEDVGVLGGAENVNAVWPAAARQQKKIADGDVPIAGNDR